MYDFTLFPTYMRLARPVKTVAAFDQNVHESMGSTKMHIDRSI